MPNRYPDAALALGLLPAPPVIQAVDYEAIRAARIADMVARFQAQGIPYDVSALETDSGVILQETGAGREQLNLNSINDAAKAVMPLYARKGNQDQLFSIQGIRRLVITPADPNTSPPTAAVMEDDDSFLARFLVAGDGNAPGLTGGGYAHVAMRAATAVRRVSLVRAGGGVVRVILQGRATGAGASTVNQGSNGALTMVWRADASVANNDGSVPGAAVQAVAAALNDDWSGDPATGSQLTDIPQVQSAVALPVDVVARAFVPMGPTLAGLLAQSVNGIVTAGQLLQLVGGGMPTDALIAAGRLAPMTKFYLDTPATDVVCAPEQVPFLRSVTVTVAYG